MINAAIQFILDVIEQSGYLGIFIFMAIESSFLPLPSEIVMIPAGYLVWEGKMNMILVILAGTFGSLVGALCNYFIAYKVGRIFVIKYGKYFFMREKSLIKTEFFFNRHGEISTFMGRLIPVARHYISLPAGLAKMNIYKFCIFTIIGAALWVSILALFGWWLGDSFDNISVGEIAEAFGKGEKDNIQEFIRDKMKIVVFSLLSIVLVIGVFYVFLQYKKKNNAQR
ncbi:DedA family protein [Helicobacter muridarum]|uniref:DedA family protein n=1 Tax=Helicobacter muridarum TaxID=216 RepID=A0A377PVW0_9HELI|nr:DedA family protein [Helicobacter muridarum]TLE00851.1 DedA family protein [Helicobacter muridarum]STQ86619.1 DedA family protein [Helicobacter muridarum]